MSRFLGHQSRDTRVIAPSDRQSLSNSTSSIYARTDGVVYDTDAHIHYYTSDAFSLASDMYKTAGIHMTGPNEIADEGGTRTLYRVIANGNSHNDSISISVGFGRSPATLSSTAAGNLVGKRTFLDGGLAELHYDDLIAVDPFPSADADKSILFYVYFHNVTSGGHATHCEFNLSVARLVGARPMMHDQRIQ